MGQKVFQPKQIDVGLKGLVYKTERAFNFHVNTNGLGFGMTVGDIKTYYRTNYYSIDLSYAKDSRERSQNKNLIWNGVGGSSSFVFGKQNSLFLCRVALGRKRYLSEKAIRKGLAIGIVYEAGISVAFLKPYSLNIVYQPIEGQQSFQLREEVYSDENRDKFLAYDDVFGGGGFYNEILKTSLAVGGRGKIGALFAFGAFEKYVKAVETGIAIDLFAQKLPLLVERNDIRNTRYLASIYLSVHIGSRK